MFPDVELALCEHLETIAPTFTATRESYDPPVIVVVRVGGGLDRLGLTDAATVQIDCIGVTRPESFALVQSVRSALSYVRGLDTEAGYLDKITETTAPIQLPHPDSDIRLVTSTWTVISRAQ